MDWNKIFLVIKREYLMRVRTRIFILSTLLIPVGLLAYMAIIIGMQFLTGTPDHSIGIQDSSGSLFERLEDRNPQRYVELENENTEELTNQVLNGSLDGYVRLNEEHLSGDLNPEYIYGGNSTITLQASIRSDLSQVIREERLSRSDVSEEVRAIFSSNVELDSRRLTETGETEDDETLFYTGIGFAMSFMIFFALIMYGTIIMKGVIEEKTSRIVEVIVSCIKPIELLTGKILGITGVALTQFSAWMILIFLIGLVAGPALLMLGIGSPADPALIDGTGDVTNAMQMAGFEIPTVNPWLIFAFFLYFILGYFLYSALFAAIGSAVDSEADTQQLLMPVVFLVLIALFISSSLIIPNPTSTISVVASMFPFFTPINMVTRLAIGSVPIWQIILSLLLMIVTITGTMWISARIYRAGILQYGNKAGFKEMFNWIRQE